MRFFPAFACKPFVAAAALAVLMTVSGQARAQDGGQSDSPWQKACITTNEGQEVCHIQQEIFVRREVNGEMQTVGRLVLAMVRRVNTPDGPAVILDMWLPLGSNLPVGARMVIDQGEETALNFQQCNRNGCLVRRSLDEATLNLLKLGNTMRVGFLPFGSDQTVVGELTLQGFTAAFNTLE